MTRSNPKSFENVPQEFRNIYILLHLFDFRNKKKGFMNFFSVFILFVNIFFRK